MADNARRVAMQRKGQMRVNDGTIKSGLEGDAVAQFQKWTELSGRGQQMMLEFWTREADTLPLTDPLGMMATWQRTVTAWMSDPAKLLEIQTRYMTDAMAMWQSFLVPGHVQSPVSEARDKRFAGEAWHETPVFDFLRQSYLLASNYLLEASQDLDGMAPKEQARARFLVKQFVDAMSPTNFALTNPDVMSATMASGGANLLKGLEHLLEDLKQGRMKMTDEAAFEVGVNVAATPGRVVFENRLFQLIQYAPTTDSVCEVPLLVFPPWINKFYILDLTPQKSFIRWTVSEGLTVFMVSWKSADESLADVTLDSYVNEGMFTAIDEVRTICGGQAVHTIGYCVAGTTLAAALAVLAARGEADKVASATFFTAQVDMSECGDLGVFIDDAVLDTVARLTAEKPWVDGRNVAQTFNMLRANDLIWNYVVNNYLLGKDYFPFDLLYWNSDATNLPALWYQQYLKDIYRDNLLVKPGGISCLGVPVNLSLMATPAYVQGGKEDHIAPAPSAYKLTRHFTGDMRYVLAGSGHIAGVVNPPAANKYQYWTNEALPATFEAFVEGATEHKGSWWPDWRAWLAPRSGAQIASRVPEAGIEAAPGRYVKERI